MELTIIQLGSFDSAWRSLRLTDDDLQALERELLTRPAAGAVMPGCGGLRKLRFSPPSWHQGKRGATRVVYGLFPVHAHAYLVLVYSKNEQDNLTPGEKRQLRQLMTEIGKYLERRR